MHEKIKEVPVEEYTSQAPVTITEDTSYPDIVELMQKNRFRHLPVVVGDKAVGIISERNLKLPMMV